MRTRLVFLSVLVLVATCAACTADVPQMINYQGKLLQPSGAPVPDGGYNMQFAIYDVPTGSVALWFDNYSGVQVKNGLFSVLLGSAKPITETVFASADRYFGLTVGADPEMVPRQKIASVAFAQVAKTVVDASITTVKIADQAVTTAKIADGAITAEKLVPGAAIPAGVIVMWSGSVASIPSGWALCDGGNGAPDLRAKFIIGTSTDYAIGATGGLATISLAHSHTTNDHVHNANHNHGCDAAGDHQHSGTTNGGNWRSDWSSDLPYQQPQVGYGPPTHSHDFTTNGGGSHAHGIQYNNFNTGGASDRGTNSQLSASTSILPPYYALAFIMKLP